MVTLRIDDIDIEKLNGAFCFNEDFQNVDLNYTGFKHVVFLTDPPYNQNYHYDEYEDCLEEIEYIEFLAKIPSPRIIIHYPEETINILPQAYRGEECLDVITWVYNNNQWKHSRSISFWGISPDYNYNRQPYKNPNDKRIKQRIKNGFIDCRGYDWFEHPQVKNDSSEKTSHPCQIPVAVFDKIIKMIVKDNPEDYLIIDPFCGSGSSGVAALKNNVDFIGFDISLEYTQISNKRFDEIKFQTKLEDFV